MYAIAADEVFSEEVCRVVFPLHFVQLNRLVSDSLLNPEALGVDVPQLAQSLAPTDSNGGRRIGPHPYRQIEPQVAKECLVPQAYSSCFHHPVELRLA